MDNNIKKIISLIAFIFILSSLIVIIFTNTANGYEVSIYDSYPLYFWLFLLISIFCGFIIMVIDSLNDTESKWWKVGFFIVIFSNLIVLLLPFLRGYLTFGRGDVLSHIGYSSDIIITGHFPAPGANGENFYPIIHILMSSINQFTGLNLELIAEILPILFILFYMISMYLLSKEITKDNRKSILITAFASVLLFKTENLMLAPSVQAFFLLPFILFLFYKSYSKEKNSIIYSFLFVLMLLLIPFFHPGEGSLYLIPLFLGIYFSLIVYNKFKIKEKKHINVNRNLLNAVLIIFVTWATWFLSFSSFGQKASKIANWIIFQSGNTNIDTVSNLLVKANLSSIQFVNLVVDSYGQQLIYIVLGLLISFIILIRMFYHKKNSVDLEKFTFSMLFLIFMGLAVFSFFSYTGVDSFRGVRYVLFASTILIGIFSYDLVKNANINYKKFGTILIISILMVSSVISVFNVYPSPTTKNINSQVTQMELTGSNWFIDNRNQSLAIESINYRQITRFAAAILGQDFKNNGKFGFKNSPVHFNYTNTSGYGDSLVKDEYYVDWKANRIFYPDVYPEYSNLWKFTPQDFNYLDNRDNSVNSIYSNGEFWVYYIKSNK